MDETPNEAAELHNEAAYASCEVLIGVIKSYQAQLDAPSPNPKALHHLFEALRTASEDLCTQTNALLEELRAENDADDDDDDTPVALH